MFLEGIITFISPCLLPMLPLYISYFAGDDSSKSNRLGTLKNSLGFVLGFSIVFVVLGAFAGSFGQLLLKYDRVFDIVSGFVVILFGLAFLEILKIPVFSFAKAGSAVKSRLTPVKSIGFGVVFSISWTPCVGAFLGSALVLASKQGSMSQGIIMLMLYSIGLGIPFVLSALLIDSLKSTINILKRYSIAIRNISGGVLIFMGILMMMGRLI